jgi:hypothetical protein
MCKIIISKFDSVIASKMTNIRPLSKELAKRAEDELHENPDRVATDIESIRHWLQKCAHINSCMDDQFIISFLRGCEYKLEIVKQKLDMFYTVRTAIPLIITNRDPLYSNTRAIIKAG